MVTTADDLVLVDIVDQPESLFEMSNPIIVRVDVVMGHVSYAFAFEHRTDEPLDNFIDRIQGVIALQVKQLAIESNIKPL